jgi:DNA-binding response OmpR family regulator
MRILYVEDDLKLQLQIVKLLRHEKHEVFHFADVVSALKFVRENQPDVLLCDYRLEGSVNGLALAKQVRQLYPACTIVMISFFTTTENVIEALEMEVDAYIQRPVPFPDLLDKLYAAVERRRSKYPLRTPQIVLGPLTIDESGRSATWYGQRLDLTPTEYALLAQLVSRPGYVFTPVDLCAAVRGVRFERQEARQLLKPHLSALRAKLTQDGKYPQPIRNIRGQGYQWLLSDNEEANASPQADP